MGERKGVFGACTDERSLQDSSRRVAGGAARQPAAARGQPPAQRRLEPLALDAHRARGQHADRWRRREQQGQQGGGGTYAAGQGDFCGLGGLGAPQGHTQLRRHAEGDAGHQQEPLRAGQGHCDARRAARCQWLDGGRKHASRRRHFGARAVPRLGAHQAPPGLARWHQPGADDSVLLAAAFARGRDAQHDALCHARGQHHQHPRRARRPERVAHPEPAQGERAAAQGERAS
mmetsp:Transcript_12600/g.39085  ORF Transcript_12600/g.39085 Transcript_12600/m.39085 type:complete len:232 (-) Transcript_12600:1757-2452(-)